MIPKDCEESSKLKFMIGDAQRELDEYLLLDFGWDGYYGEVIDKEIVNQAKSILNGFSYFFNKGKIGYPDDIIPCPSGDGTIDIKIVYDTKEIFFLFDKEFSNQIHVTRLEGERFVEERIETKYSNLEKMFDWLVS